MAKDMEMDVPGSWRVKPAARPLAIALAVYSFPAGNAAFDGRRVRSFGFTSVRAQDVVLSSGRWYFEAELHSEGLMQFGWGLLGAHRPRGENDGVGDDAFSCGFDGYRKKLYVMGQERELPNSKWARGDRVGCAIDLDARALAFSLNGRALGEPIDLSEWDVSVGVFPCFTMRNGQECEPLFAAAELRHVPHESFLAIADYYEPYARARAATQPRDYLSPRWLLELALRSAARAAPLPSLPPGAGARPGAGDAKEDGKGSGDAAADGAFDWASVSPQQLVSELCRAAACKELAVCRYLLDERGVNPNAPDPNAAVGGDSELRALHFAASRGALDVAMLLLAKGAQPRQMSALGLTPLVMAARDGQGATVDALLQREPDPDSPANEREHLVAMLLCVDALPANPAAVNALHVLARRFPKLVNRPLVELDGLTKAPQARPRPSYHQHVPFHVRLLPLLHVAVMRESVAAVELLLQEAGADGRFVSADGWSASELNRVFGRGKSKEQIARLLAAKGAPPAQPPDRVVAELFLQHLGHGDDEAALALVRRGALPVNSRFVAEVPRDRRGSTLLVEAMVRGRWEAARVLADQLGANVTWSSASGVTPAQLAAESHDVEVIRWFFKRHASPQALIGGFPLLHWVCAGSRSSLEAARLVVAEFGADVSATSLSGETPLFAACKSNDLPTAQFLVERSGAAAAASAYVNQLSADGRSALLTAIAVRSAPLVDFLLARGALATEHGLAQEPLVAACAAESPKIVELLLPRVRGEATLTRFSKVWRWKTSIEVTPLMLAAVLRNTAICRLLVAAGAPPSQRNGDGYTALHFACERPEKGRDSEKLRAAQVECLRFLAREAKAELYARAGAFGLSPLHVAARWAQVEALRTLVGELGCDAALKDRRGMTPLMMLCSAVNPSPEERRARLLGARFLATRGVDLDARTSDGKTALTTAAASRLWEVVEWLSPEVGSEAALRMDNGKTVLDALLEPDWSRGGLAEVQPQWLTAVVRAMRTFEPRLLKLGTRALKQAALDANWALVAALLGCRFVYTVWEVNLRWVVALQDTTFDSDAAIEEFVESASRGARLGPFPVLSALRLVPFCDTLALSHRSLASSFAAAKARFCALSAELWNELRCSDYAAALILEQTTVEHFHGRKAELRLRRMQQAKREKRRAKAAKSEASSGGGGGNEADGDPEAQSEAATSSDPGGEDGEGGEDGGDDASKAGGPMAGFKMPTMDDALKGLQPLSGKADARERLLDVALQSRNTAFLGDVRVDRVASWWWNPYARSGLPLSNAGALFRVPMIKYVMETASYLVFLIAFSVMAMRQIAVDASIEPVEWVVFAMGLGLLKNEMSELAENPWGHFRDGWNVMDFFIVLSVLAVAVCRFLAHYASLGDEGAVDGFYVTFMVFGSLVTWLRALNVATLSPSIGPLLITVGKMGRDVRNFFLLTATFIVGSLVALTFLIDGERKEELSDDDRNIYGNARKLIFFLQSASLTGDPIGVGNFEDLPETRRLVGQIFGAVYKLFTAIVLVNLLIALMASTYDSVKQSSEAEFRFGRIRTLWHYDKKPNVLPPPLNLLSSLALVPVYAVRFCCPCLWPKKARHCVHCHSVLDHDEREERFSHHTVRNPNGPLGSILDVTDVLRPADFSLRWLQQFHAAFHGEYGAAPLPESAYEALLRDDPALPGDRDVVGLRNSSPNGVSKVLAVSDQVRINSQLCLRCGRLRKTTNTIDYAAEWVSTMLFRLTIWPAIAVIVLILRSLTARFWRTVTLQRDEEEEAAALELAGGGDEKALQARIVETLDMWSSELWQHVMAAPDPKLLEPGDSDKAERYRLARLEAQRHARRMALVAPYSQLDPLASLKALPISVVNPELDRELREAEEEEEAAEGGEQARALAPGDEVELLRRSLALMRRALHAVKERAEADAAAKHGDADE